MILYNMYSDVKYFDNIPILVVYIIVLITIANRLPYLYAFIVGGIGNVFLNRYLKSVIKEPRPNDGGYGMPSGHSQNIFYAIGYLYFSNKIVNMEFIFVFFLGLITICQRFKNKFHTKKQLIMGSILGVLIAYLVFFITEKYLHYIGNKSKYIDNI